MSIEVTERAAKRIRRQLAERGHGIGLRLGIKKSGCSGYAYLLDYADAADDNDAVFGSDDAKLVVRREHLPLLDGLKLDFVRDGLNEVFRFDNPNAKALCGCGESFTVETAA